MVMNAPSLVLETGLSEPSLGAFLPSETWLPLLEPPSPRDGSTVQEVVTLVINLPLGSSYGANFYLGSFEARRLN